VDGAPSSNKLLETRQLTLRAMLSIGSVKMIQERLVGHTTADHQPNDLQMSGPDNYPQGIITDGAAMLE
jgi:hypothetical protein